MFIKFNVDIKAICADIAEDKSASKKAIKTLIRFWERHGVLAGVPKKVRRDMIEHLQPYTDHPAAKLLHDAIAEPGSNNSFRHQPEVSEGVILRDMNSRQKMSECASRFELALVGQELFDKWYAPSGPTGDHDENCVHCGGVYVVPWQAVAGACTVEKAAEQENWIIPIDATERHIWDVQFKDRALYASKVVVVDPYVSRDCGRVKSDLITFLRFLIEQASIYESREIAIYTTIDSSVTPDPASNFKTSLRSELEAMEFSAGPLSVFLFDRRDGVLPESERFPRDRWVRFDEFVFVMHGIDILTAHKPGDSCNLLNAKAASDLRELEDGLRSKEIGKYVNFFRMD